MEIHICFCVAFICRRSPTFFAVCTASLLPLNRIPSSPLPEIAILRIIVVVIFTSIMNRTVRLKCANVRFKRVRGTVDLNKRVIDFAFIVHVSQKKTQKQNRFYVTEHEVYVSKCLPFLNNYTEAERGKRR